MVTYGKALLLGVAPILDDLGRIIDFPKGDVYIFDGCNKFFSNEIITAWENIYFTGKEELTTDNTMHKAYLRCNRAFINNPKVMEQLLGKTDVMLEVDNIVIACKYDTILLLEFLIDLASTQENSAQRIQSLRLDLDKIGITKDELYEAMIKVINNIILNTGKRNILRTEMLITTLWAYDSTQDIRYKSLASQIASKTFFVKRHSVQSRSLEKKVISTINMVMNLNIPGGEK